MAPGGESCGGYGTGDSDTIYNDAMDVADAVWDVAVFTAHNTAGRLGARLRDRKPGGHSRAWGLFCGWWSW